MSSVRSGPHLSEQALNELLDGQLAGRELAQARAHLSGCAGCRAALQDLQAVAAALAALPEVLPAREIGLGVVARLPRRSRPPAWKFALAVQTGAALALGLLFLRQVVPWVPRLPLPGPAALAGLPTEALAGLSSLLQRWTAPLPAPAVSLPAGSLIFLAASALALGVGGNALLLRPSRRARR